MLISRVTLAGRQLSATIKTKQRLPSTKKSRSCKSHVWQGGYQRTRTDGSNTLSGCSSSRAGGDLVIRSISTPQNGAQSRDLPARRGWDSKSVWHSVAQTYWLRAEAVLLCYHSPACTQAAFLSEPRCVQPALASLLDCGDVSKERSVMSPHRSTSQGCSCLVVSVYESYAVFSASPLGPWLPVPLSQWTIPLHPPRGRWKRNNPLRREVKIAPAVTSRTRLRKTQGKQG